MNGLEWILGDCDCEDDADDIGFWRCIDERQNIEEDTEDETEVEKDEDVLVMEAIKVGIDAYHQYLEDQGLDSSYYMPEMKVKFMDNMFETVLRSLEYKEIA